MKDSTICIIRATLDGDDTMSDSDREAVLAVCRDPGIASRRPAAESFPRLVPVGEAASLLSVHPRTVWRLIRSRRLRSVTVGRGRRIRVGDLADFVEHGRPSDSAGSTATALVEMGKAS